jgi:hypothetical protein
VVVQVVKADTGLYQAVAELLVHLENLLHAAKIQHD